MQHQKERDSQVLEPYVFPPNMGKREEVIPDRDTVAWRLKVLRLAFTGDNQTAFAKRVGVSVGRWNNYEIGFTLTTQVAFKLLQTFPGLTLDWIYLGNPAGLTFEVASRLRDAEASLIATTSATRVGDPPPNK